MFRDSFYTVMTGEDYHLGYGISRYTGLRNYVLPGGVDPDYLGFSRDYFAISSAGDSTGDIKVGGVNKVALRIDLSWYKFPSFY